VRLTTRVAVAAFACLLGAGPTACETEGEPVPPEQSTAPTSSPPPAADGPAALQKFYSQQLTWGSCAGYGSSDLGKMAMGVPGVQCARMDVPLSYSEPDGPSVQIAVVRKPAQGPGQRIGSLVINPGGPGASGTEAAAALTVTPSMSKLNARFDVVGFDPRGIGASRPQLKCLSGQERDADRADDGETDGSKAGVAATEKAEREFAEKCAARTEHGEQMLANLGTRDVVHDLDVLRSVLGDQKLSYIGYSYGTRIGYTYAEQFPTKVRALLLDGALDPEQDVVESLVAQGAGFGKAFGEFARWCAKRSDCALGSDPKQAVREYQQLVRPLIERNRGEQLVALADQYMERNKNGTYGALQNALVAIRCIDDPPVKDKAKIRAAQRRFAKVAAFLDPGTPIGGARDACAFWPAEPTGEPHLPNVEGVPPTLVISTTGDPATPYKAGVQLAKAMGGRLLTFEGTQHTIFAQGNKCVDDAGVAYLLDGALPKNGTPCQ
jgi:pimeloyl-ACP methyl ester carboxylesterase